MQFNQAPRRAQRAAAATWTPRRRPTSRERQRLAVHLQSPDQPDQHDAPGHRPSSRCEPSGPTTKLALAWSPPSAACCWPWPAALLLELLNRRVRSVDDLSRASPACRSWPPCPPHHGLRARCACWRPRLRAWRWPTAGASHEQPDPAPAHRPTCDISRPQPREAALPIGALAGGCRPPDPRRGRAHPRLPEEGGLPFGEAGIAMGLLTDEDVQHALALQFGHATCSPDAGLGKRAGRGLRARQPRRGAPAQRCAAS